VFGQLSRRPRVIVEDDHDQALLQRCRDGDRAAFTLLVIRYQRPIYNAAYRVLGNAEDASDIAQGVFLKVAERLEDYDPQYRFFSWIYRIAINESLNLLRRNAREEPMDDEHDPPDAESAGPEWRAAEAEIARRVQRALMRLKGDDRAVLTLRHFSDCSYQEIGHILEIEEKTVKWRLFEARQRLRALLKDLMAA
jgi:RNA polymerase sigma-70 factor (ECF subfamily)